ncbi:MAG TPA: MaoC family dehydratase [Hyphomicrobiales bacterium]|nr:MaoC family dehydratase [Rhodobiaceae bacterium]HXK54795.1 MaoC family dehydratase [Hyphomicrobiales bacterium]
MTETRNRAGGYFYEDLSIGMEDSFAKTVTDNEIQAFADLSGDRNPIHLDEKFAASTAFGGRIAHGLLSAAFISTVLGTKLPGPGAVYASQTLRFLAPVRIGDEVTARVRITELNDEKKRVTLNCECVVGGENVIEGVAIMRVPSRAD